MDEQHKFKILKKRLEAMNYKFSFSPDSVSLIEALLNDLSSLNHSFQRLKTQQINIEGNKELSERLENLTRDKFRLEEELQRSKYGISKGFTETENLSQIISDLRRENIALTQKLAASQNIPKEGTDIKSKEYIDKLFNECNSSKQKQEEAEENLKKAIYENRYLQDKIKSNEGQLAYLKQELDVTLLTLKDITNENRLKTEEFYSLKQVISSYESKYALLKNESSGIKLEIQKIQKLNSSLEQQLADLNKENAKSRNEIDAYNSSKIRLTSQIELSQRQSDLFQIENNKLQNIIEENKRNLLENQTKYNELEKDYQDLKDKIKALHKENHGLSENIRDRGEELRTRDQIHRELDREIKELRAIKIKYEESLIEIRRLKDNIEENVFEVKKLRQNLDEVRGNLKYKEEELRQYKNYLEQANKDIEILKHKLEEETRKMEGYNICQRNNLFLEDQFKSLKNQFEDSVNREKQQHKEIENCRILLQKQDENQAFISKQLENAQNQKSLIEQDNIKLQRNLSESLSRDNSKTLELNKLEHKLDQAYSELDDLKRQLNKTIDELVSTQEDYKSCQKSLYSEQSLVSRQNDQILQLKDYLHSLEENRNDYIKKLENQQLIELDQSNIIKTIKDESNQIRKQLSMSEKICSQGVEEKESLINQINSLKYENNKKNDEILSLKNSLKIYMNEIDEVKLKKNAFQDSEENFKRN